MPETMACFSFSVGATGLFSCVVQASASTPMETPPIKRVLIDFRLSMTGILNVLFFHLVHDILARSHGKSQYGPGYIFIRLRNKGTAVHAKQITAIESLTIFIQGRIFGVVAHAYGARFMNDIS